LYKIESLPLIYSNLPYLNVKVSAVPLTIEVDHIYIMCAAGYTTTTLQIDIPAEPLNDLTITISSEDEFMVID
jgi:hypothetical protein